MLYIDELKDITINGNEYALIVIKDRDMAYGNIVASVDDGITISNSLNGSKAAMRRAVKAALALPEITDIGVQYWYHCAGIAHMWSR